jgi:hypothetical protein
LLSPDKLKKVLEKKTPIKTTDYSVFKNGCMLFEEEDKETTNCKRCNEPRYLPNSFSPVRTMQLQSVGQQVASMLAVSKTRELMRYRSQYQPEVGVYKDYFDGETYKMHQRNGLFSGEDDVAVGHVCRWFYCNEE